MKTNRMFLLLFLMAGLMSASAQDAATLESEVPGDNFSLEGALELFKKSASPEEFERKLNASDSRVNNLDLNNDGNIDYIRVIDRNEGNVHAFILQAVLSNTESQDVAVIELEKLENGRAVLQIVGDADVYGIETIIEPTDEVRINAGTMTSRTVVNVWTWPSVQYVYGPSYAAWVSPWSWSYHPGWWSPWSPVAFHVYHPWWNPYRPYYSYCYNRRVYYGAGLYAPYRRTSVIVYNNYRTQIDHYRSRNDRNRGGRYDNGRGRSDGGRYGDRNRVSDGRHGGRDRNNGRERFADNRRNGSSDGSRDNSRGRFNSDSRNERRTVEGGRSNESSRSRMSTPERNTERSSPNIRRTPNNTERNTNFERGSSERNSSERNVRQAPTQQPRSNTYSNPGGGRQQRSSSPSYNNGGSSGNKPSFNSGGSRSSGGGRSSGGSDRGGSRNNDRGRH